jgi:oxaloacetate decarboxylase beta subunit
MLFLGNLLKESGVTNVWPICTQRFDRCGNRVDRPLLWSQNYCRSVSYPATIKIFLLGATAFAVATAAGVLFAKIMNLFTKKQINPLIGNAGVSAVPASARVSQMIGQQYDRTNYLLMHAMAPNVAGVVGSAVAAGVLLGILGN